jgi:hypothetical protein
MLDRQLGFRGEAWAWKIHLGAIKTNMAFQAMKGSSGKRAEAEPEELSGLRPEVLPGYGRTSMHGWGTRQNDGLKVRGGVFWKMGQSVTLNAERLNNILCQRCSTVFEAWLNIRFIILFSGSKRQQITYKSQMSDCKRVALVTQRTGCTLCCFLTHWQRPS